MPEEKLLQATALSKKFHGKQETHLFSNIFFEIKRGESIAIVGASGEGKSTLLNILGTLERPSSGSLHILGKQVSKRNAPYLRNKHIGFVFQSFHLLEDYTTLENVLMPARIAKNETHVGSKAYKRALDLLDQVGLSKKLHIRSKLLSGGEKQRVALARAICNDPELILADEPSGNLDFTNAELIHKLLLNYAKEHNKGVIIVTHDLDLATLCDHVYVLQDKQLFLRTL